MEKTTGEKIIRTEFNPSSNSLIDEIKNDFARLYNKVNSLNFDNIPGKVNSSKLTVPEEFHDFNRNITKSINYLETSAMYAVKAVTSKL